MIDLYEPQATARRTGGYRYNERICRRSSRGIRLVSDTVEALTDRIAGLGSVSDPPAVVIADSLLLDADRFIAALDALGPQSGVRRIGLVHYLAWEDPCVGAVVRSERAGRFARAALNLDGFIAPSGYAARAIRRFSTAPVVVVSPGVDNDFVACRRLRSGPPVGILTVGAVRPQKGLRYALEALGGLRAFDWRWTLVGDADPGYLASLEARASRLGIRRRISFVPGMPAPAVAKLMSSADMLCAPSLQESYGMVCAEAAANALPVVASGIGGVVSIIRHRREGLLVRPGSVISLRSTLADCFGHRSTYLSLARTSFRDGNPVRSWDSAAAELDAALGSFLSQGQRAI